MIKVSELQSKLGKVFFQLDNFEGCYTGNVFMTVFDDLDSKEKIDKKHDLLIFKLPV